MAMLLKPRPNLARYRTRPRVLRSMSLAIREISFYALPALSGRAGALIRQASGKGLRKSLLHLRRAGGVSRFGNFWPPASVGFIVTCQSPSHDERVFLSRVVPLASCSGRGCDRVLRSSLYQRRGAITTTTGDWTFC